MASYRVLVTYNVEVKDSVALLSAGRAAWTRPSSWAMAFDEHGAVEVDAGTTDEIELTPEASIAFVLGAILSEQRSPSIPGVSFTGMGINAVPVPDNHEGDDVPPLP